MKTLLQHRQKLWLLMLMPLLCSNFLLYHLTLEKGNRLQMTALNGGLHERFWERAEIAGWTAEYQLYQLKVHLDHTASDVFRMIPGSDQDTFDKAVVTLRKRFKPKDIEELCGIEFYQLIQENESIEQYVGDNCPALG